MEFSGLISKFPVNRRLTESEKAQRLSQECRINLRPQYHLGVIKMNSTFLEMTDKWFPWKGAITAVSVIAFGVAAGGFLDMMEVSLAPRPGFVLSEEIEFLLSILAIMSPLLIFSAWMFFKECFAFTHYPIRFNRRTAMVHVFRTNGTVLSVPWKEVYFTLGHMPKFDEWEVRGNVLDRDGVTVRETFALSYTGALNRVDVAPDGDYSDQDFVRAHFEFVRRYMEEGPQAVTELVQFCMPVAYKRESPLSGLRRVFANLSGSPLILIICLSPFCALFSVFRVLAMWTSRIPHWPAEIEQTCQIADGDPYAIEGNSGGDRVAVFPESANAAGVAFRPRCRPSRTDVASAPIRSENEFSDLVTQTFSKATVIELEQAKI